MTQLHSGSTTMSASTMLEDLAEQWARERYNSMRPQPLTPEGDEYDARWWLDAVVAITEERFPAEIGDHSIDLLCWLRTEANRTPSTESEA